jgi:DNA-binding CsgD family transcriptional regulator
VIISEENYLSHIGTLHKSGRYPWGSGDTETQRNKSFLDYVEGMHKQGLTDTQIAKGMDMSRAELQAKKSIYKNAQKQADISMANKLHDSGMSNMAIGIQMGINESSVRALRDPSTKLKADQLMSTANMLKDKVDALGVVDIGAGVEHHILGVSRDKLDKAVAVLQEKGYYRTKVQVDQLGTTNKTTITCLAVPGTTYADIAKDIGKIKPLMEFTEDNGLSWSGIEPPISVSSSRVKIRYAEQGGSDADGVVYVRRNVDDLSLGGKNYAQVRIAVDGTHYLKGMAMFKDDLPKGVDLMFNTNKSDTGDKHDAMKPIKIDKKTGKMDEANPFGAVVRQLKKLDENGAEIPHTVRSAMNIVNDEGQWEKWSKSLSSQMLSKQNTEFAKAQLAKTFEKKTLDLDEISSLTNAAVRVKLLKSYADSADSSAVHLKAAAMPRQGTHVILPVNKMKDNEVYAPKFNDGERVALIRFPHGGIFEIPELIVNNRQPDAKKLLGAASDAIGINSKVAERLSGADFDGDTVLVIPNNSRSVKTAPALAGLKNFNPKDKYPAYEGMVPMSVHTKGVQMGVVSNLITDMTIMGATPTELARAVRHSMVVIDAEKHNLNYKQSAVDNGIAQLKTKYQGKANAGAATLISRARHRVDVPKYKLQSAKDGGPIDRKTGALIFVPTGESYVRTTTNKRTGVVTEKVKYPTQKSKALVETTDARTLLSGPNHEGTPIERVYADHSNKMKGLANMARLEMINTPPTKVNKSAKTAYATEVASLNAKLILAQRNSPLERQAQVIAGAKIQALIDSNKDMENSEKKKMKYMALETARTRTGAKKPKIVLTDSEWAAIQAGAISRDRLDKILDNADLDQIKQLATPRAKVLMTTANQSRARAMAKNGATQAEIASALGVSVTTLKTSLSEGG